MNRIKIALASMAILMALVFSANSASAVRIKIATKSPENFKSAQIVKKMAKDIEEKTARNVRFKIYYGGVKGSGRDLLLKMKTGEIQGGEFTAGEASSVITDLRAMQIPFTFNSLEEVDYVLKKITPHFETELGKKGYVVLGWLELGFAYLMSVDKISSQADMQGKKAWIPQGDPIGQKSFEALGVPPIPMTISDVMIALQTGQINTVANALVGAIALQWHTTVKYVTDVPLIYVYSLLMITQEAYDQIPAEHKTTVHEIIDKTFVELKEDIRKSNKSARQTMNNLKIEFVTVPPANYSELVKVINKEKQQWSAEDIPKTAVDLMQQYKKEYRTAHPQ